jgi:hypothetical protein
MVRLLLTCQWQGFGHFGVHAGDRCLTVSQFTLASPPSPVPFLSIYSHIHQFFQLSLPSSFLSSSYLHASHKQETGDILFVPQLWGHATVNMAESIGFASEFIFGSSEFSMG